METLFNDFCYEVLGKKEKYTNMFNEEIECITKISIIDKKVNETVYSISLHNNGIGLEKFEQNIRVMLYCLRNNDVNEYDFKNYIIPFFFRDKSSTACKIDLYAQKNKLKNDLIETFRKTDIKNINDCNDIKEYYYTEKSKYPINSIENEVYSKLLKKVECYIFQFTLIDFKNENEPILKSLGQKAYLTDDENDSKKYVEFSKFYENKIKNLELKIKELR